AEMHGERQRRVTRRARVELKLLPDEIEAAADPEPPSLTVGGQHVPAVNVGDVEASRDAEIIQRTCEVKQGIERAVDARVFAADQRGDFAEASAIDPQVQIDAVHVTVPAALDGEGAE